VAVRIRLQRKGAKHMAFFRIVAADSRSPRDGRFIEQLGYYDPLRDPPEIKVETDKVIDWLSKGAQPSETVESLLRRVGIMQIWHEVKNGKSVDELRQIEDDARKRLEAKASMEKRKKEDGKKEQAEAPKAADAEVTEKAAEPAIDDTPSGDELESPPSEDAAEEPDGQDDAGGGEVEGVASAESPEEAPSEEPEPVSQEKKPE
jgi:small subunit ribosomal protein S16